MRAHISNLGREFDVLPDQTLLDAAIKAGLNLPHSCKGGNCGSCLARLIRGEYDYPNGTPLGISPGETAQGFVLLCQARARSDVELQIRVLALAGELALKRLPGRIERCERLAHDVLGVHLRLPAAEEFTFQAGQYIDVVLPGGRRRSFSIASRPDASRMLELHVRHVPGGEFTDALFGAPGKTALLRIEGPLGQFVYRESAAPMLLIGGGTGFAPLNSIITHVIAHGLHRVMTLYWGCRAERDLYADARITALARTHENLRYVPVLSDATAAWSGERGLVHEAVLRRETGLIAADIYAAGPPGMIEAVRREFAAGDPRVQHLYFDSFDYAPDSVERHRRMASSIA